MNEYEAGAIGLVIVFIGLAMKGIVLKILGLPERVLKLELEQEQQRKELHDLWEKYNKEVM